MLYEPFLSVVGFFVNLIAIPVSLAVGVGSQQKALEVLCWPDDVKDWLRRKNPSLAKAADEKTEPSKFSKGLRIILGLAAIYFGGKFLWSVCSPRRDIFLSHTLQEQIAIAFVGVGLVLGGLTACLDLIKAINNRLHRIKEYFYLKTGW